MVFVHIWSLFTFPPNGFSKKNETNPVISSVYQPFFPSQVRTNKAEFESLGEDAWWMHEAQLFDGNGGKEGKDGVKNATTHVVLLFFWLKKKLRIWK